MPRFQLLLLLSTLLILSAGLQVAAQGSGKVPASVLPSWKEGKSRAAIVDFVKAVSDPSSADFVPVADRIAVFDNDGTLWCEKPYYTQLAFAIDRAKQFVGLKPGSLKEKDSPLAAAVRDDVETLVKPGAVGTIRLLTTVHAGLTTDEYEATIVNWLQDARHPRFKQPYTSCVYKPMLELLDYFRANGFKTFIVSGGGIEFMRPWTEKVYGIPPEQVVGSTCKLKYEVRDGRPCIIRSGEVQFVDDQAGKPVGIHEFIGKRPLAAFGNSDGDLQMLQWTMSLPGQHLAALIHHTDGVREYAYDRNSIIGRLNKALDMASAEGWTVVDMKEDWKEIFSFDKGLSSNIGPEPGTGKGN